MKQILDFVSPLYVTLGRKKYLLNLNTYRNLHYRVNNLCKQEYKKIMASQMKNVKKINKKYYPIQIHYTVYPASNRRVDIGNICCVVEKYFEDALTFYGIIEDDNYDYISDVHFHIGHVDKDNPRCLIDILVED